MNVSGHGGQGGWNVAGLDGKVLEFLQTGEGSGYF